MKLRFFTLNSDNTPAAGCIVRAYFEISRREEKLESGSVDNSVRSRNKANADAQCTGAVSELSALFAARVFASKKDGASSAIEKQTIDIGTTRTDRNGYGRIDIDTKLTVFGAATLDMLFGYGVFSGLGELFLEIAGNNEKRQSLTENTLLRSRATTASMLANTVAQAEYAKIIHAVIDGRADAFILRVADGAQKGPTGHVADPDTTDYRFSPASFVVRESVKMEGDGCEHLTPATLPLRQYPIYHIAVNDPGHNDGGSKNLPTIDGTVRLDSRILWGRLLEFEQSWSSLGHSLGEVKYSLALAPGEATRVAVIDWKRADSGKRNAANSSYEDLLHDQSVDRDIDDIAKGNVSEQQSGSTFMAGLAGAMDFQIPQYGISAAGRHSVGVGTSNTQGRRDVAAEAHQDIHQNTLQRSNLARSQNSSVVVQATQTESNYLATRIVANMNRGHSLSVLYYEILRHLAVRTEFRRADPAILVPVETFVFDAASARRFRTQIEPVLLDSRYSVGFDALERLSAGYLPAPETSVPETSVNDTPAPVPAPSAQTVEIFVTLITGQRWEKFAFAEGGQYVGLPDTGGAFSVSIDTVDGGTVDLVKIGKNITRPAQFAYMRTQPSQFPDWIISQTTSKTEARHVTRASIDLRKLRSITVKWSPLAALLDGWNLRRMILSARTTSGTTYTVVDHSYQPATELFPAAPDTTQEFRNIDAQVVLLTALTANSAPPTERSPQQRDVGEHPEGDIAPTPASDSVHANRLVNHLNDNQFHYNAAVWLLMDSRERRRRVAAFSGSYLAGMSDMPLAMIGNHLAPLFRRLAEGRTERVARCTG